jgi:hypothetical protein
MSRRQITIVSLRSVRQIGGDQWQRKSFFDLINPKTVSL